MKLSTEGFAIAVDGAIDVRTVMPTERAAKVNWLVASQQIMITRSMTDEIINMIWEAQKGSAQLVPVQITGETNDH